MPRTGVIVTLSILCVSVVRASYEAENLLDHPRHFDTDDERRCDRMAEKLSERERRVQKLNPDLHLKGTWVSSDSCMGNNSRPCLTNPITQQLRDITNRCEVRPGPEFLLRQYRFDAGLNETTFHLRQFRYSDRHCKRPLYSVSAWGRLRGLHKASWVVPGAVEADVTVHRVAAVPYSKEAARKLERSALVACSNLLELLAVTHSSKWAPYEERPVYSYSEEGHVNPEQFFNADVAKKPDASVAGLLNDLDCLKHLHMDFNELQLLRLELRPASTRAKGSSGSSKHENGEHHRTELLLGDIHTRKEAREGHSQYGFACQTGTICDFLRREHYRPTAFQPHSLLKAKKAHHHCSVCHRVLHSSSSSPPILSSRPHLPVAPEGEWLSRRCETRPNTLFLTRRLSFFNDRTWQGLYQYYKDEHCTDIIFSIVAKGRYIQGEISHFVDGGTEYEFKIKQAIITPHTKLLAEQLNVSAAGTCGRRGQWQADVPMDVTPTGGCAGIGLKVPLLEHDLLRMTATRHATGGGGGGGGGGAHLLLYLGQTETDPDHTFKKRPTSYQPPLVQCHSHPGYHIVTNELFPLEMAQLTARAGAASAAAACSVSIGSALVLLSLFASRARYAGRGGAP